MAYSTLFFDLDDTLYARGNGLWNAIRERMSQFMSEMLGLPECEISRLRRFYYETYGTTLRGLQKHHQVDADEYLAYVHDLSLQDFLQPAPELRVMLLSLPQRRWVFTNADADHARRVLAVLGLLECFMGIIDIRALNFACKPEVEAYQRALALAEEDNPSKCVLLDDSPHNLAPARAMGFTTLLIGPDVSHPAAQYCLPSILDLPRVMPELWIN